MALLPCNGATAQQVLAQAAAVANVTVECAAEAAEALRGDAPPTASAVEAALRAAIDDVLATPHPATPALLPDPHTLRHHLARFRDLRRRTFVAPDNSGLRARYEDAGYTLCVMLGHRMFHHAINAAEQLVAIRRLDGPPLHRPEPET
ncbi:DUF5133 domain-containing protein [Streptomyces sp. NPDC058525]|uniref:DUF5133 domain-containing protein n=1 Tax=Streptomyces sp. NPDC058525 TaxID=3346538 RepID=UPI0036609552